MDRGVRLKGLVAHFFERVSQFRGSEAADRLLAESCVWGIFPKSVHSAKTKAQQVKHLKDVMGSFSDFHIAASSLLCEGSTVVAMAQSKATAKLLNC